MQSDDEESDDVAIKVDVSPFMEEFFEQVCYKPRELILRITDRFSRNPELYFYIDSAEGLYVDHRFSILR